MFYDDNTCRRMERADTGSRGAPIYRGTLTMHEDDQLFLDSAEDHMQKEQEELLGKMNRLTPWVRICGAGSAVLLVVMAGVYLFTHLTQ